MRVRRYTSIPRSELGDDDAAAAADDDDADDDADDDDDDADDVYLDAAAVEFCART